MQRLASLAVSVIPWLIIGGLLYAGLFVKPKAEISNIELPPIGSRDLFLGVASPQDNVVWLAGNWGKILRSDDGGQSWKVQETPVKEHLQDIAAWDSRRAVAVGNDGIVLATADGGETWVKGEAPRAEIANKLVKVWLFPEGRAWAVGAMNAVLYSEDYGATWTRKVEERDIRWGDVAFIDAKTGWVVGEFGEMLHTVDGGETWENLQSGLENSLTAIAFRDAENGVAVGLEGALLVTSDGGATWTQAPEVTQEHLYDIVWTGKSWFVAGDKGVYLRGDKTGSNWRAGHLAERDLSWHTEIAVASGAMYLAGASVGAWDGNQWTAFGRGFAN